MFQCEYNSQTICVRVSLKNGYVMTAMSGHCNAPWWPWSGPEPESCISKEEGV